jgi:hypothetical protein
MKVLAKVLCSATIVAVISGCASQSSSVYVPPIPPAAQAKLLDYYEQPGNKVFIIAVDPGGEFAYAFDYGKSTLKEAAKVATEKCDASREASGIFARPYIYALNNKVVYEEMIKAANKGSEQAQVEKVDSKVNADAAMDMNESDAL